MAHRADLLLANRAFADHALPRDAGEAVTGAGGLVAAVGSAIEPWDGDRGTLWVGAGRGEHDREFVDERGMEVLETPRGPLLHRRLFFDDATWAGHYESASNSFLWPLLHLVDPSLPDRAAFFPRPIIPSSGDWHAYERTNAVFAAAAAESGRATTWIHDYQLALAPAALRALGYRGGIGFFLHTPFPPIEALEAAAPGALPLLDRFVAGIAGADLAGFQTERDRTNFLAGAARLPGTSMTESGVAIGGRTLHAGVFPVGVNAEDVREALGAPLPAKAAELAASGLPLVVGLERADFTKGVPERLMAMERAYRDGSRFAYFGSSSPTRQGVALYDGFDHVIGEAASRAAAAAEAAGCPFVQQQSALSWGQVVALLAAADVVFTSSLADGMNLVPLQAAVAQESRTRRGAAMVGRDAGAAHAYRAFGGRGLVVIDPLDVAATAEALAAAVRGETPMTDEFVEAVRRDSSEAWASRFIAALEAARAHS
jgi:trehalose 6-phosphate synthase